MPVETILVSILYFRYTSRFRHFSLIYWFLYLTAFINFFLVPLSVIPLMDTCRFEWLWVIVLIVHILSIVMVFLMAVTTLDTQDRRFHWLTKDNMSILKHRRVFLLILMICDYLFWVLVFLAFMFDKKYDSFWGFEFQKVIKVMPYGMVLDLYTTKYTEIQKQSLDKSEDTSSENKENTEKILAKKAAEKLNQDQAIFEDILSEKLNQGYDLQRNEFDLVYDESPLDNHDKLIKVSAVHKKKKITYRLPVIHSKDVFSPINPFRQTSTSEELHDIRSKLTTMLREEV